MIMRYVLLRILCKKKRINKISKDLNIPITVIGETVEGREVRVISEDGLELEIESGYKHF